MTLISSATEEKSIAQREAALFVFNAIYPIVRAFPIIIFTVLFYGGRGLANL